MTIVALLVAWLAVAGVYIMALSAPRPKRLTQ